MSTSKQPSKVAIVGGGIAGLSAAYYLHQKSPETNFCLFEKNAFLGGNIQTKTRDGFMIETGPDAFLFKPVMEDLIKELGLFQELITPNPKNRKLYILRDGKLRKVPKGFYLMGPTSLLPFLFSNTLSLPAKLRTLIEPWIPKQTIEDESLGSFVERRFGKRNLTEITQAMIGGIYTADPYALSLSATLPRFIEFEQKYGSVIKGLKREMSGSKARGPQYSKFRSFSGGMQSLIDSMEKTIPHASIERNTLVQSVDYENGKWVLRINGIKQVFDYLIMATPARAINHLCNFLDAPSKKILKSVDFASTAIAHFGYKKSQIKKNISAMGMLIPHQEKRKILASTFCSQKFEGRAEHDHVLLRVFLGGVLGQELLSESDATLIHTSKNELEHILQIRGEPLFSDLIRWPNSMPQYTVGHQKRMQQFFEQTRNLENISFLGNTFEGVGIPDLIQRSKNTIEGILS